jgi:hypothetical protein
MLANQTRRAIDVALGAATPVEAPAASDARGPVLAWLKSHPGAHLHGAILAGVALPSTVLSAALRALVRSGDVETAGERRSTRYSATERAPAGSA